MHGSRSAPHAELELNAVLCSILHPASNCGCWRISQYCVDLLTSHRQTYGLSHAAASALASRVCGLAGEEMTYDYRFAGDEKLRCNCGAASCRGWVNAPGSSDSPHKRPDGSTYLPRRELAVVKELAGGGAAASFGSDAPAAVQRLAF
jgi:hypothetical protein